MAKQKRRPQREAQRPSKRRPGSKLSARDAYEAEDSDPDEVKHAERYDKVDNYEYEMPSDFEDEEIDEDLAFTAEDKVKYRAWFSDEEEGNTLSDAEEDGGHEDNDAEQQDEDDDEEVDLLDSDDDDATIRKASQAARAKQKQKRRHEDEDDETDPGNDGPDEMHEDEDEDLLEGFGDGDDEEDDDGEDEGEGSEGDLDDDNRYRDMLTAVVGSSGRAARQQGQTRQQQRQQHLVSEAYPESEYNLNPGATSTGAEGGELTIDDLVRGLGADGKAKLGGAARKLLKQMATPGKKGAPVSAPLPRQIKERQERRAGYEQTSTEVTKWQSIVKANREAPTLVFTSATGEVPRVTTTAAIAAKHTPETDLEREVAALLEAAGAASAKAVQEAEDQLALKALTMEEAKARRDKLAKMRSLLFYHEMKAKRLKAIKSKEYHRKLAKAEKRKADRLGEGMDEADAEALKDAEVEAEFERAKERLTLKHRNTSKWARRALKRGLTVMDEGTKAALAEQLRTGDALRKRIEGLRSSKGAGSGSDSEGTSASDIDDGEEGEGAELGAFAAANKGRGMSSKAKAAALEILEGGGKEGDEPAVPTKGLFSLPFMVRALQRQRQAAKDEAEQLLHELEEQEQEQAGTGSEPAAAAPASGRMRFGGAAAAVTGFEDADLDQDLAGSDSDGEDEDVEAKAERLAARQAAVGSAQASGRQVQQGGRQPAASKPGKLKSSKASQAAVTEHADANGDAGAVAADRTAVASGMQVDIEFVAARRASGAAASSSGLDNGTAGREHLFRGRTAANEQQAYIPAKRFQGAKPGMVFKKGPKGLGYYLDENAGSSAQGTGAVKVAGSELQLQQQQQKAASGAPAKKHQQQRRGLGDGLDLDLDDGGHDGKVPGSRAGAVERAAAVATMDDGDQDGADLSREGMRPAPAGKAEGQRDLISMAFAGDDVEEEFAKEKADAVAAELPHIEEPSSLPGWGAWSEQQRDPKWMRDARDKVKKEREKAAESRKDAGMRNVVISEKWDKKAAKYLAPQLPFPFNNQEAYERSLRQPLGREYNPDTAFRNLTRPAVIKTTGVVIDPIRYSKAVARDAHGGGMVSSTGVAKVAGGMLQPAQGAGKKKSKKAAATGLSGKGK
mmetsp:Transcript_5357/g.11731  ORF Transcript_5357/g.11731 Transcript_5357/m.11731 type:complete len:1130 (-) Transcript_5357:373-3762(-)